MCKRSHNRRRTLACLVAVSASLPVLAVAQAIPDPTRPPTVSTQSAGPLREAGQPRLQSTLISPQRREAVIDGEWLREGDRLGEAQVLRILPGRVILRGPEGEIELTLSFVTASTGVRR